MKYLSIIKYILLIVSAAIVLYGAFSYAPGSDSGLDTMLWWGYILVILSAALALIMPLFGIAQEPKKAVKSLLGLGLLVVIFLVSYGMASGDPIQLASGKTFDNTTQLIFSDTSLYAMYIMFGCVVLSLVVTEIYKAVKN